MPQRYYYSIPSVCLHPFPRFFVASLSLWYTQKKREAGFMRVVGIIAEYNPFHSGHAYHLAQAKARANADYALVIMSGDYVQRGEPAMFPKMLRARWALQNGADLVLALPAVYSLTSAAGFAMEMIPPPDRISRSSPAAG